MPNLLRFPIVLISIAAACLWLMGTRDKQAATSLDEQHDELVLRVDKTHSSSSDDKTHAKRRATLKVETSLKPSTKTDASPVASRTLTRARIVGLSPAKTNDSDLSRPSSEVAADRFEQQPNIPTSAPPQMASPTRTPIAYRTHRIVDGDDLRSIAQRYLGDSARHLEIFKANRESLSDPELLPIGTKLKIPPT